METLLEVAILDAAYRNTDDLDWLLQEATECLPEEQTNKLFDKVEQILREQVYEIEDRAREWCGS